MKKIEYIFLPSRTYRGNVEIQLDACNSLEDAKNLVIEKCDELFRGCTTEDMTNVINEGPKENVYSFIKPEDHPDLLLYYPEGNGNWPVQILRIKLTSPLYIK